MYQIFILDTEQIFKRACELRDFGDNGDMTWQKWYQWNATRTGFSSGELEKSVAETLGIPTAASNGFCVTEIDGDSIVITDAEDANTCDLSDASDAYMIAPVTSFREWLHNWNKNPLNQVLSVEEAAVLWGLSPQRIRALCSEGKVQCRKLWKEWLILRNQPSPKQRHR